MSEAPQAARARRRYPFASTFSPAFASTLVLAAAALAAAFAVRHLAIEPAAIAHVCDPAPWAGGCVLRTLVILGFVNQEVGWLAFASGVLATLLRAPRLASVALVAGCAGLVLYSYEPAAVGALLGLLVRARAAAQPASTSISAA
jgi:hypothetical protein